MLDVAVDVAVCVSVALVLGVDGLQSLNEIMVRSCLLSLLC